MESKEKNSAKGGSALRGKKSLLIRIFVLSFLVSGFFSVAENAFAANLNISPSSGTYAIGESFSVFVTASNTGQSLNAVDGVVSFPVDKLQISSISKESSIISLWAEEPSFSNSTGKVSFSGIVLNPGFSGASGKVLKLNFNIKKAGNAAVVFSSGSILANDGKGTNILNNLNNSQFTLVDKIADKDREVVAKAPSVNPMTPVVSSSTHPDGTKWYSNNNALFNWTLPAGAIGLRISVDHDPSSSPNIKYPPNSSVEEKNLADGVWYFHLRFENKNGLGETAHFRFNVDTQPPEKFEIKFPDGNTTDNSRPDVLFAANDLTSGINKYTIRIDNNASVEVGSGSGNAEPYTLPDLETGTRKIEVTAYDMAGNSRVEKAYITILPSLFMRILKTVAGFIFFGFLILLLFAGIYFLVLRTWHGLFLLHFKLKDEVREVSVNQYIELRKKIDEEFALGNYLSALSGYRKLQEQTPPIKQPELNERINLTAKLLIMLENFKRGRLAAINGKWQEAATLLEDGGYMMDANFIYHEEAQKLYAEVQQHLLEIASEKRAEDANAEKKLADAQNLVQETKEKLAQEHGLLLAEKEKREQKEIDNSRVADLLKQKELVFEKELENAEMRVKEKDLLLKQTADNAEIKIKERELSLKEELKTREEEAALYQKKLSEAMSLLEDTKIKLAEQQGTLEAEKIKREQIEEEKKKIEKNNADLAQEKDLLQAEKTKNEELEKEVAKLENLIKEKDTLSAEALAQVEVKINLKEAELKKEAEASEAKMKEKETILEKKIADAEAEMNKLKDKLAESERLVKETKAQLLHEQELLAAEKSKAENLLAAISKFVNPDSKD